MRSVIQGCFTKAYVMGISGSMACRVPAKQLPKSRNFEFATTTSDRFSIILFFGIVAIATCEIVGAPEDVDPMDKTVQRIAQFAVGEIGSKYTLLEVISGTKQVVSGMLYNLEIVTKRKIKGEKVEERRCRVIVYKIKAEDYFELEEFHCYFNEKEPAF